MRWDRSLSVALARRERVELERTLARIAGVFQSDAGVDVVPSDLAELVAALCALVDPREYDASCSLSALTLAAIALCGVDEPLITLVADDVRQAISTGMLTASVPGVQEQVRPDDGATLSPVRDSRKLGLLAGGNFV